MHIPISSSAHGVFPATPCAGAAGRPLGLSGFDVLATGGQGFLPDLRRLPASESRPFSGVRGPARIGGRAAAAGLDGIERKVAQRCRSGARRNGELLATVGISVPFLAVFVLGCLTLA